MWEMVLIPGRWRVVIKSSLLRSTPGPGGANGQPRLHLSTTGETFGAMLSNHVQYRPIFIPNTDGYHGNIT